MPVRKSTSSSTCRERSAYMHVGSELAVRWCCTCNCTCHVTAAGSVGRTLALTAELLLPVCATQPHRTHNTPNDPTHLHHVGLAVCQLQPADQRHVLVCVHQRPLRLRAQPRPQHIRHNKVAAWLCTPTHRQHKACVYVSVWKQEEEGRRKGARQWLQPEAAWTLWSLWKPE